MVSCQAGSLIPIFDAPGCTCDAPGSNDANESLLRFRLSSLPNDDMSAATISPVELSWGKDKSAWFALSFAAWSAVMNFVRASSS